MEQKLTLITALERIWEASPKSQLSKEFLNGISEYTNYVGGKLHINPVQSVLLAILLDHGSAMSLKEMADHLNCSNIRMMVYEHELTEMHRMWIIGWQAMKGYAPKGDFRYSIRPAVEKAIMDNSSYQAPVLSEFTAFDVIDQIGKWMRMIDADNELYDKMYEAITELLNDTIHLKMSKELLALNLVQNELMMLIVAMWQMVINHKNVIEQDDYQSFFRDKRTAQLVATCIDKGCSRLTKLDLLENDIENGISVPKSFRLTDHAIELLLCDVDCIIDNHNNLGNVILPEQIANKELFYNERERQAIDGLRRLLEKQQFLKIQERLTSHNLRKGFTCLFYGQPGTGKTESAFQLCKESGRSVVVVDAAELKSKWLGDSEKRIQSLFKQYEKMVRDYKTCPVLLFNEADAIIGKRTTGINGSVSRTENTCQNIILQAMENFSGIMIATTNLTESMDAAFERRFLYKIKFDKPETVVKQQIWQSMIPSLTDDEAYHLSHSFDFSGGQIENISRKTIINTVLYNTQPVFSQIKQFCYDEEINNRPNHIGFNT